MRGSLIGAAIVLGAATLYACGRGSSEYLTPDAGPADNGSQPGPDASSTAPSNPSTPVAPSVPALQSPVPPDGPCVTPAGQVTKIFDGNPSVVAIDPAYVYTGDPHVIVQIPLAGGSSQIIAGVDAGPGSLGNFIGGAGAILYQNADNTLGKILVPNDAMNAPRFMATGAPYPALVTDGLNVYAIERDNGSSVLQMPIDGSPTITTPLPAGTIVFNDVATADGLYIAAGQSAQAALMKVARNTGVISTIFTPFSGNPMTADDDYIYYLNSDGGALPHDVYRIGKDGSGNTMLATTDDGYSIAVDAHNVYVSTGSQIAKVDKVAGGTLTKLADSIAFTPLFVMGGNVYFFVTDSGVAIPNGIYTVCK